MVENLSELRTENAEDSVSDLCFEEPVASSAITVMPISLSYDKDQDQ